MFAATARTPSGTSAPQEAPPAQRLRATRRLEAALRHVARAPPARPAAAAGQKTPAPLRVAIAGAGVAGCILASQLMKLPGVEVRPLLVGWSVPCLRNRLYIFE
jgi:hypothetical protein